MTDDKPKKYQPRAPRQIYADAPKNGKPIVDVRPSIPDESEHPDAGGPSGSRLPRQAPTEAAGGKKRSTARKTLAKAEKAAKPLAKPKKRGISGSKKSAAVLPPATPDASPIPHDSAPLPRQRAPGAGRPKKTTEDPWKLAGMSRSQWYRAGKPKSEEK